MKRHECLDEEFKYEKTQKMILEEKERIRDLQEEDKMLVNQIRDYENLKYQDKEYFKLNIERIRQNEAPLLDR